MPKSTSSRRSGKVWLQCIQVEDPWVQVSDLMVVQQVMEALDTETSRRQSPKWGSLSLQTTSRSHHVSHQLMCLKRWKLWQPRQQGSLLLSKEIPNPNLMQMKWSSKLRRGRKSTRNVRRRVSVTSTSADARPSWDVTTTWMITSIREVNGHSLSCAVAGEASEGAEESSATGMQERSATGHPPLHQEVGHLQCYRVMTANIGSIT